MANKMRSQAFSDYYKSLFDNMLDGLAFCQMIFDPQGQPVDWIFVEVNKNFEKLTGLKKIVGKRVTAAIPGIASSNPELFEIYGRVSLTGKPESFETYVKPLLRWFFVSVYSPKKNFFVAVFTNITSQKQTEREIENARIAAKNVLEDLNIEKSELEIARAKEEAILLSIGDGLVAVDESGNVTVINESAQNTLGFTSKEIIGKPWIEVIQMEDEKGNQILKEKRPMTMALSQSKTTTTTTTGPTYYYVRKDKTKFPVAVMTTTIILNDKSIGAIEIFRDITRQTEVDKAKSEFVSLASHELRTPLTVIDGLTTMILDGEYGAVSDNLKQPLLDVSDSSERLIRLVNDLLNVSRIQTGRLKYILTEFSLIKKLKETLTLLGIIAEKKNITLTLGEIPDVYVQADEDKFEAVINNIIGNALKFTDRGSISISAQKKDDVVEISMTDTGIGIAREDQTKLFGKFEQISHKGSSPAGTGLGLYISKEMVQKMGGDVWLSWSEPGKGSTFIFSVPIAKTAKAQKIREGIEKEAKTNHDQKSDTIKKV